MQCLLDDIISCAINYYFPTIFGDWLCETQVLKWWKRLTSQGTRQSGSFFSKLTISRSLETIMGRTLNIDHWTLIIEHWSLNIELMETVQPFQLTSQGTRQLGRSFSMSFHTRDCDGQICRILYNEYFFSLLRKQSCHIGSGKKLISQHYCGRFQTNNLYIDALYHMSSSIKSNIWKYSYLTDFNKCSLLTDRSLRRLVHFLNKVK